MYAHFHFGKHNGRAVKDVDTGYLKWCLRDCDCLDSFLRRAIEEELRSRSGHKPVGGADTSRAHPLVDWSAIIRQWQRDLAMKWHPDRGGDVKVMAALNDAADRLRKLVGVG